MAEEGSEFYTVEGAARVRELLPAFEGGDVIIGVLGNFFKCPAAPFETAFMLHDYLEKRGLRATSTIKIVSLMGMPIPISPEASTGILEAAGERDIEWCPQSKVTALDPATKIATLEDRRIAVHPVSRHPGASGSASRHGLSPGRGRVDPRRPSQLCHEVRERLRRG
jgi:sulfide:quinone oxidoreductase